MKLYTTHCPKCKIVEMKLNQLGLKYEIEENVDKVVEKGKEVNILSAPILEVDGTYYDFAKTIKYLKEGN